MRFELTDDQRAFGSAINSLLAGAHTTAVARAWADGDHAPGLKLWSRLADQGVNALIAPEQAGGIGATPVELVVAFEPLGFHAVPGPWIESAAYLPVAVADGAILSALASGAMGTVSVHEFTSEGLDADVVEHEFFVLDGVLSKAVHYGPDISVDRTRRLHESAPDEAIDAGDLDLAFEMAVLAVSAQLLGLGERLLTDTVTYAKQRRQFGREIGSYQAIKHALADVRIALDFARPLIYGAALSAGSPDASRDASAAKVAASDAAYLAARTALQVHGAIGYTRELDLSLWVLKVRALVGAWGTPAYHRSRILDALVAR